MRISDWSSDVCSSDLRVALILDIFALRAQSHEGKLQVELAQLQHLSTRLTRMWSHLERQRGGIGMRGPGEAQLEMDRRMIGDKVRLLRERLARVQRQRTTQRRARRSEEHTSELQSLMRISYAVFCLKKKKNTNEIAQ